MNFVFISPNFPVIYSHFVKELKAKGVNVLGIGDQPYSSLCDELKDNLTEYCYVSDMNNLEWMINTVQYLKDKYGNIDYIESNNEYWMRNDAKLREWFNVEGGYRFHDLEVYQAKSQMKQFFQKAGLKTARYIMASSLEESLKFVNEVGYPVFAKPDSGVGAASTFKIKNENDLRNFHRIAHQEPYIMEEFIKGSIVTFDGIANKDCEVVICFQETFPTPIAEVVSQNKDMYYYAKSKMPKAYKEMGQRIVKAFNISSRCFHIELWKLLEDKPGLAKKGDVIALEANLRSPGGNTPELLNLVSKNDYYETYANMIVNNVSNLDNETNIVSYSINRKYSIKYKHDSNDIMSKFSENLKEHGTYPDAFRDALGDEFFLYVFEHDAKKEKEFLNYVLAQK